MNEITKELLDALEDLLDANAIPSTACKERAAYDKAHAAIAKAEAILAATEPSYDDWIPWEGGDCPVAHSTTVDVRLRSQGEGCDVASNWLWLHETRGNSILKGTDIVAYRVVKP